MAIQFIKETNGFVLTTKHTTYAFDVLKGRYLRHLYYGKKITEVPAPALRGTSFSSYVREYGPDFSPDAFPSEISYFGAGDFRQTALRFQVPDGTDVADFVFDSYEILDGGYAPKGLPCARGDAQTKTLAVTMTDPLTHIKLILYYTVFEAEDVIARGLRVVNEGNHTIKLTKCMPLELCLEDKDFEMISFYGHYAGEFSLERTPLHHGLQTVASRRGTSSHQTNPFMALCRPKTNGERGEVYGFNLVYSGSFETSVEVDQMDTTKVLMGLGSECFAYTLDAGACFDSPQTVMTYSAKGLGQMSRNFHSFILHHILPKESLAPHPVVLNTWEACYFDIDANKLVDFARTAAPCGFDMLVMDDGWFGNRHGDHAGLGDWRENQEKFPMGLASFVKEVCQTGLSFGIWIEPEMVNEDSDLYRTHPEWCLQIPGRDVFHSRNQLVLDFTNLAVIAYLKEQFETTFDGVDISYFKWDMNRHLNALYSAYLPCERQGEIGFRYLQGVYALLDWFRERFPKAVIETCSGGGGRYDLGMMCYGFQIWLSDNTDPYARVRMQSAALTAYPATTMSCHVSNPQGDLKSLDYRYKVALGGMLGYELNILNMSTPIKEEIGRQIAQYKTLDEVIRLGDYYPLVSPLTDRYAAYAYVAEDKSKILLSVIENKDCPKGQTKRLKLAGADGKKVYTDLATGQTYTGGELKQGIRLPLSGETDTAQLMVLCAQ